MRLLVERMRAPSFLKWDLGGILRAGLFACALAALALLAVARMTVPSPTTTTKLIGRPAPAFTLPTAQGGAKLPAPTRFVGAGAHPTLLVFFNTLCVHCLGEMSAARQAAAAPDSPLDVIYIDTPGENAQITGAFMARLGLDPPVLLDTRGAVAREYAANYAPTLVLVDTRGVIRDIWVGETSAATLTAEIHDALQG